MLPVSWYFAYLLKLINVFSAQRSCSYLHVKEESFICFGCYFLNLRCTLREISCGFFIIKISRVNSWCMMTFRNLKLWQLNTIDIVIYLHIKIQYLTHLSNACALENIFNLIQSKLTYKSYVELVYQKTNLYVH